MMRNPDLRALLRDMDRMVADTDRLVQALANDASADVAKARSQAERSLETARGHLQSNSRRSLRRALAMAHSARHRIRSNPSKTLGIAAGVGLLIGSLYSRR
jgi:ElaB/YqjD/DUF883 family membrane-anchored ribosome-binding protein